MNDPHVRARDTITTVDDEDLGPLKMQNLMFRLQDTPAAIRWTGRRLGQDNEAVYASLGIDSERLAALQEKGVVRSSGAICSRRGTTPSCSTGCSPPGRTR